jgi:hypothetical protein
MNIFVKLIIGCVIGLLCGALMLCFEMLSFMMPFIITLMVLSGVGTLIFTLLWLSDAGYSDLL